jgi:hypothetical protein
MKTLKELRSCGSKKEETVPIKGKGKKKVEVTTDSKIKTDSSNNTETTVSEVRSADKKPEKYVDQNGKTRIRMVPVVKEAEQIDEVSTKTLSSYLRKAASSSDDVKKRLPGVQKAADKLNKKTAGTPKVGPHAPMRVEEIEQVDEISKKTLGSYVKKAQRDMSRSASSSMLHKQLAKDGDSTQDKYAKDATKDVVKRRKGIDKAVDRLTKEGTDSLSPGWMLKKDPELAKKLKDKIDLAKKRQASYGDKSKGVAK